MNKKYKTRDKVYVFKLSQSGRWTNYQQALSYDEMDLLTFAQSIGYANRLNESPRGSKAGDHFLIKKYFTTNSMLKRLKEKVKQRDEALEAVLKSDKIDSFTTLSKFGSIKIDDIYYSCFNFETCNIIDVWKCVESEFRKAKYLSRREIFNSTKPITIVKFEKAKTISIAKSDYDLSTGDIKIDNVIGFAIWEAKAKIFVI